MKIEFPILWVDDNEGFMDSIQDEIHEHLDEHGMQPSIDYLNPTDPNSVLLKVKASNPYLIILDYKMDNGLFGDQVIQHLRENDSHHDIMFYTLGGFNSETFSGFFTDMESPLATGIHFCSKESAKDKICALIDLKLSHYADLPTQRGWIVADAIELERKLNETISLLGTSVHPLLCGAFSRLLESERVDFGCRHRMLQGSINDLIKFYNINEPTHPQLEQLKEIKIILKDFREEIIELRNSIAHQAHHINKAGVIEITRIQKKTAPISWTPQTLKRIRTDFKKHMENLSNLEEILTPPSQTS